VQWCSEAGVGVKQWMEEARSNRDDPEVEKIADLKFQISKKSRSEQVAYEI